VTEEDPLLGRTLAGRYRLIARLGRGAMSTVYLARHVLIERLSAIKVLHQELAADPQSGERFLREARAVNRINHPNIVEISDYGEATVQLDDDRHTLVYLVMEYVPGESLRKLIDRGKLPPARVLPIAAQVAAALSRAHQTEVIHRDVKPDNILLQPRRDGGDLAKLTDFGVAKMMRVPTASGDQVFGTPGYIAPEYLLGETKIDGRADLYSLGVVMYEALTGALPFEWSEPTDLLTLPMTEDPIPARTRLPSVPVALDDVIMHCLRRRPDDRPRDAFVFLDELQVAAGILGLRALDPSLPAGRIDSAPAAPPGGFTMPAGRPTANFGSAASEALRLAGDDGPKPVSLPPLTIPVAPSMEVGPDVLVASWYAHFAEIDRRITPHRLAGKVPITANAALERSRPLLDSLQRTAAHLVDTQQSLDALATRGREFRTTLGRAIDHAARDLSKAHGRVVDLKKRRVELHLARRHADDTGQADALLWEEAAIDSDLKRALETAAELGRQIGALQDELFAKNNDHEAEVLRATGVLEGEAAALATLHRELELLSGELASVLSA